MRTANSPAARRARGFVAAGGGSAAMPLGAVFDLDGGALPSTVGTTFSAWTDSIHGVQARLVNGYTPATVALSPAKGERAANFTQGDSQAYRVRRSEAAALFAALDSQTWTVVQIVEDPLATPYGPTFFAGNNPNQIGLAANGDGFGDWYGKDQPGAYYAYHKDARAGARVMIRTNTAVPANVNGRLFLDGGCVAPQHNIGLQTSAGHDVMIGGFSGNNPDDAPPNTLGFKGKILRTLVYPYAFELKDALQFQSYAAGRYGAFMPSRHFILDSDSIMSGMLNFDSTNGSVVGLVAKKYGLRPGEYSCLAQNGRSQTDLINQFPTKVAGVKAFVRKVALFNMELANQGATNSTTTTAALNNTKSYFHLAKQEGYMTFALTSTDYGDNTDPGYANIRAQIDSYSQQLAALAGTADIDHVVRIDLDQQVGVAGAAMSTTNFTDKLHMTGHETGASGADAAATLIASQLTDVGF